VKKEHTGNKKATATAEADDKDESSIVEIDTLRKLAGLSK